MKRMTKVLALILALVMTVSVLPAAFAEEAPVTSAAPVETVAAQLSLEQQVLSAYAEAMLLRGERAQYDASQMVPAEPVLEYRFQVKTLANEDYTSQFPGFTNCAAFVHDICWFALGLDIELFRTVDLIKAPEPLRVFYYKPTGKETDEEKAAMQERFMATLQPSDILVYRSHVDTGHAMFHTENGRLIHSTTPTGSYNMNDKKELREVDGTVQEMQVEKFFEEGYSRNFFTYCSQIAILRPLNLWEGTVPQESIDRMNNLKGVLAEKLASKTAGQTVMPGEEVTFTIRMENRNETPVTLTVTDQVPQYTTLVSGDMKWDVTIEAGKTAEVSYTVKVNADAPLGTALATDQTVISGVTFRSPALYVGKHLTADQKAAVAEAAKAQSDKVGLDLAKAVYADTGVSLDTMDDLAVLFDSLYQPSEKVGDHYVLNGQSPYFAALAPSMYGGSLVETSDCFKGVRTRGLELGQLEVGDIFIATFAPFTQDYVMHMVLGEDSVLRLDEPQLLTGQDAVKAMDTALGYHKFAVIRPAALPEKEAVAGLTASEASVLPDVAELTGKGETVTLFRSDFENYEVGEDALWQTILAGDDFATNVTEKDDKTVRYDIVEEDGNKVLQLFSAKKKAPWLKVNEELVGNFSIQLDFKYTNTPRLYQWLYLTLYQDSKTHAFVHVLQDDGVRFQYKPLSTDQTSTALNVPPYMFYPQYATSDAWHTIKVARVDGGLYVKVWNRGEPEPADWMISMRNDVLDASQPSYFRMQYYVSNKYTSTKSADIMATMLVDNVIVSRQVELPGEEQANVGCTRGEAINYLWRAMGSPEPVGKENPFTDVKESDEYYKAVLWAYENGITAGTSANTFSPEAVVKRGQLATFLYRAAKGTAEEVANPFKDVTQADYFCDPVLWAYAKGIVAGTSETTFEPGADCTQGQIVTMIRKVYGK